MKIIVIVMFLSSFGCTHSNKNIASNIGSIKEEKVDSPYAFLVQSIYLQDSTYVILVTRNDSLFKVLSVLKDPLFVPPMLKASLPPCEKLMEGKKYEMKLHSLFGNWIQRHGAVVYNGSSVTFDKESGYDLYVTENLRGNCYVKSDSRNKNSNK